MNQILVTGGEGQLGTELQRISWPPGWQAVGTSRAELDLTNPVAIACKVMERPWAAVINSAAYTSVDEAENDPLTAWKVNALAPAALGQACARAGIPLVQVSTDYVFGGNKEGKWQIDDAVGPRCVYGASKLGGEFAVRTSGARHVIVRTSWLFSAHGHNFIKTMLRLASEHGHVRVVADQHGSPTAASDLATALAAITVNLVGDSEASAGIFHFCNAESTSWAGFAREIFIQSAIRGGPTATVESIATIDYPTRAQRPVNSNLSLEAIRIAHGIEPRTWREALGNVLNDLIGLPIPE